MPSLWRLCSKYQEQLHKGFRIWEDCGSSFEKYREIPAHAAERKSESQSFGMYTELKGRLYRQCGWR